MGELTWLSPINLYVDHLKSFTNAFAKEASMAIIIDS